jgi:hypothetical protein
VLNITEKLTITDVQLWMDGGTATFVLMDKSSQTFEVEFVQKVALKRYNFLPRPGSLLLNRREVEVRSETEKEILVAIKLADWGTAIKDEEKEVFKGIKEDCIKFIESEYYIELANSYK